MRFTLIAPVAVLAASALLLTGCVDNSTPTPSGDPQVMVEVDKAAQALLPPEIASAGVLEVGIDPTYPPNEFKNDAGDIVGWEVDLFNDIAAKLGLTANFNQSTFDTIIPGIETSKYSVGVSSFFDKVERQQVVDMVSYFTAGSQFAGRVGETITIDNLCGLKVAAQNGTAQYLEDIPAMSTKCTDAGNEAITLLGFDTQDAATNAVIVSKADVFVADSPVTQFAVKQNADTLQLVGDIYDTYFYAFPVTKGSALSAALAAAVNSLIADGTYTAILEANGLTAGAITMSEVNAEKTK
jgi:polar amino acid transport system substrate-binding protein